MTNRGIETSREIRLWITGIIVPAIMVAASVWAINPQLFEDTKRSITNKIKNFKI